MWVGSKSVCENDIKGGKGCSALEIMGDCIGAKNGNHWMSKEGKCIFNFFSWQIQ